jgi:hypothetical protein
VGLCGPTSVEHSRWDRGDRDEYRRGTGNGNITRTDTKIIASTLVVRGVVPGVSQGQFQDAAREATAATGREEIRDGEERAHR